MGPRGRRALGAAALLLTLCACAAMNGMRQAPPARDVAERIETIPVPLSSDDGLALGPALQLVGAVQLRSDARGFGGFSGIEVSADGREALLLSDRGWALRLGLEREGAEGPVRAAVSRGWAPLREIDEQGAPIRGIDSEGLALAPAAAGDVDGPFLVSHEIGHRVMRHPRLGGVGEVLRRIPNRRYGVNRGFEALATDRHGRLILLREGWAARGMQDGLREDASGALKPFLVPTRGDLLAVGADLAPDGSLWLVERSFSWVGGFGFGISRLAPDGDGFAPPQRLMRATGAAADNAEGIAVWRDGQGRTRALVVTDDNQFFMQRTVLYEFALPAADPAAGGDAVQGDAR